MVNLEFNNKKFKAQGVISGIIWVWRRLVLYFLSKGSNNFIKFNLKP